MGTRRSRLQNRRVKGPGGGGGGGRDALEGEGPQRRPQKRFGRRLEEVAEAVGGGYCRLHMPLKLALGVRGTVAGHRLGALQGGGGGLRRREPPSSRQTRPEKEHVEGMLALQLIKNHVYYTYTSAFDLLRWTPVALALIRSCQWAKP